MTVAEVPAAHRWRTNAHMIADVARLGYLNGTVLDATYGEGGFWTVWRPETLVTNDLYKPAEFDDSYRALHFTDGSFDSVVFDPPYRLGGTPDRPDDARFGNTEYRSREEVLADIHAGAVECFRVTRHYLLVKCMDAVEGGRVRWQTDLVTGAIAEQNGRKVDRFEYLKAMRAQPSGRAQRTARRNYSTLLVFEKV